MITMEETPMQERMEREEQSGDRQVIDRRKPTGMADLDRIYTHHPPRGDQADRYQEIRAVARTLAECIVTNCPESRERSVALTNLQQAVMWANAAIAIHQG
jgi:hypothetical protein